MQYLCKILQWARPLSSNWQNKQITMSQPWKWKNSNKMIMFIKMTEQTKLPWVNHENERTATKWPWPTKGETTATKLLCWPQSKNTDKVTMTIRRKERCPSYHEHQKERTLPKLPWPSEGKNISITIRNMITWSETKSPQWKNMVKCYSLV